MHLGVIDKLWSIDTGCIVLTAIDATGCDRLTLMLVIVKVVDGDRLVRYDRCRWCG
jgi:hypothetical protein